MKKSFSRYSLFVHLLVLVLTCLSGWLSLQVYQRKAHEQNVVEKYKPSMESLCSELNIDVRIESFDDLLDAFEKITTRTSGSQ